MSNRRLAAIVFADIVGYTEMMQTDELEALKKLHHFRNDVNSMVPEMGGTVVQYYGDGRLLAFNSAVEAVKCGAELQTALQNEPAVPARMGVHQGDILTQDGNV